MSEATETVKIIPLSEVANHASSKDCYMAIDGLVYNVTEFLEDHPGGPEIMMEHAGKYG
jgi:cytochrome b involved in lipid metabolism